MIDWISDRILRKKRGEKPARNHKGKLSWLDGNVINQPIGLWQRFCFCGEGDYLAADRLLTLLRSGLLTLGKPDRIGYNKDKKEEIDWAEWDIGKNLNLQVENTGDVRLFGHPQLPFRSPWLQFSRGSKELFHMSQHSTRWKALYGEIWQRILKIPDLQGKMWSKPK